MQVVEVVRTRPEELLVRFLLVNPDAAAPVVIGAGFSDSPGSPNSIAGVYLLDEARQKKSFVMRDEQGRPLCTSDLKEIPPGGQVAAVSRFPASAPDVDRVTVQVPGLPAFRGLPVTAPVPAGKPQ